MSNYNIYQTIANIGNLKGSIDNGINNLLHTNSDDSVSSVSLLLSTSESNMTDLILNNDLTFSITMNDTPTIILDPNPLTFIIILMLMELYTLICYYLIVISK